MNKSDFLNFACKIIEKEGGLLWYTKPKDGVYSTREITRSLKVTQLEDIKKDTDFFKNKDKTDDEFTIISYNGFTCKLWISCPHNHLPENLLNYLIRKGNSINKDLPKSLIFTEIYFRSEKEQISKDKINKINFSLLTYYENPQLKARDEKMETLIFNRRMLLNQLFKPTDENYQLLKEFNETLKEVVIKNYQHSRELYYNTKKMLADSGSSLQFEGVECKIFLGKDRQYSKSNPFQGEDSEMIWEILNDESYNDIYCKYGCCMSFDGYHGEEDDKTEMELMGLQDADDCWNEGLDREWSYDLHLHQHFHNLYDHTSFSIFDFIYVRDFYTEFELKFNQNT